MRGKTTILAGVLALIAAGLFAGGSVQAADTAAKTGGIGPTIKIFKGDKCVRPTEDMRRNHMKYILHQRDQTMHEGIRTETYQLTNCVDCHADPKTNSVLGKDGFCSSCHQYAAVTIDCFSCHSPSPENNGQPPKAAENERPRGDQP